MTHFEECENERAERRIKKELEDRGRRKEAVMRPAKHSFVSTWQAHGAKKGDIGGEK